MPDLINNLTLMFDMQPEAAIGYFGSLGMETSWDWQEQLGIIRKHCFTISKVHSADVLQSIHDGLANALARGDTLRDFKNGIEPYLKDKGYARKDDGSAWRWDTIFRTNLSTAYNEGRRQEMLRVADKFPYWQYIATMDIRTRPSHAALNLVVARYDSRFWRNNPLPRGFMCRCRMRALSEDYVKQRGYKIYKDSDLIKVGNKMMPLGTVKPDKGFGGKFKPDLTRYSPAIRSEVTKILRGGK